MIRLMMGVCALALGTAAACGGGSDGNSAPPPPSNTAPVFTSPAAASVDENTSGLIYTAQTSDGQADAVTLSVIAGGDEDAFAINLTSGEISLDDPLDFETPVDGDGDNVYEINLRATDSSGASTTLNLQISVSNVDEPGKFERLATGLTFPVFVTSVPGTDLLAVVLKRGQIVTLDPETGEIGSVPLLDVRGQVFVPGERGLSRRISRPTEPSTSI